MRRFLFQKNKSCYSVQNITGEYKWRGEALGTIKMMQAKFVVLMVWQQWKCKCKYRQLSGGENYRLQICDLNNIYNLPL